MSRERILIVDDEPELLDVCRDILDGTGAEIVTERNPERAIERLTSEPFDLAIVDIRMPGIGGIEVLRRGRAASADIAILLMTAYPSDRSVEESVQLGAMGYITKPFTPAQLRAAVKRALLDRRLRSAPMAPEGTSFFEGMYGRCEAMRRVFGLIDQVAPADVDVLITGESGTGKELVARAIHARSSRRERRIVPVDSGAIPENLLESELFGHEKGAFTGATRETPGLVSQADGGTLFLDEVGELPPALQVKLLRMLQERRFKRIGGTEQTRVDVRVLAATNRDIDQDVREGRFREDLFYRLNVVRLALPPLRERPEDLPGLLDHFLRTEGPRLGRTIQDVDPAARSALQEYPWPGNIRELLNVARRALAIGRGPTLALADLPPEIVEVQAGEPPGGFFARRERLVRSFERRFLSDLLTRHRGDVAAAAKEAEMPRGTLYRLMKKYDLRPFRHRD